MGPVILLFALLFAMWIDRAYPQQTAQRPGTVRVTPTTARDDTATAKDFGGWIEWRSTLTGTKTQFLPHCAANANGATITVIDGERNASQHPIEIKVTGESSNVGNDPGGREINSNGGVVQMVCDGVNNWIILSDSETGSQTRVVTDAMMANGGTQGQCNSNGANGGNCYCSINTAGAHTGTCSLIVNEDTLRGTDNGGLVIYRYTNRAVRADLPRNAPHSAYAPGWETIVENDGPFPLVIASAADTTIHGAVTRPNGGSELTINPHDAVEIFSGQNLTYEWIPFIRTQDQP